MPDGIAVEIAGSGPALLLIHGIGATANAWGPQVDILARSFTVIRPDLRGAGRSVTSGEISVAAHVSDIVAVLDERGADEADVVGWSYGAIVAQHLAALHPHRVKSLALLGPIAEPAPAAREALRARAANARAAGMVDIADATIEMGTSAATKTGQPQTVAFVRESVMRQDPEGYAQICESAAAAVAAPADQIKCPTMVLTGDEDNTAPPRSVKVLAEAIPESTFSVLARCGHWLTLERPTAVTESLLNFYFRKAM